MPTLTTVNMIFIGTFAQADVDESDGGATENASDLLGLYTDLNIVQVQEHDRNDSGYIADDETQTDRTGEDRDFLSYDVGFGDEAYELDSSSSFQAEIKLWDGSTITAPIAVLQTTIGDVFIRDTDNVLDNLNIKSINLVSINNDTYAGSNTGNSVQNSQTVCLKEGTRIATPRGQMPIETLRPGDLILTADRGPQPIVWINAQTVPLSRDTQSICFPPGSLGHNSPSESLSVSPDHRILVRSVIARRMFDTDEVFVPAKRFVGFEGISRDPIETPEITYWHLLLRHHAVIEANGAQLETLFPGRMALMALDGAAKVRLRQSLAAIGAPGGHTYNLSRPSPRGRAQKQLLRRHAKNKMPFVSHQPQTIVRSA